MKQNEVILRCASRFIISLVWPLLSIPAACGGNRATNEWSVAVNGPSDSAPAVGSDGTIFFGTWNGRMWALNPDGSRKWVFRAGNEIKSAPAVSLDGTVYFGCRDWKLYAVRADGGKRWEYRTGGWVDSSPALAHDGTVYFGSWDKSFYALNAGGAKQWQFKTAGPIVSSPAIGVDGTIYFGSHDKKFYALAPDGRKKWEFTTGAPILSSPALNGDQCLYMTSVDGCLYALNLDGSLRWRLRTGGITESSPVIGLDGLIYVAVNSSWWAISSDGKKSWENAQEGPIEASAVALADSSVRFLTYYGVLAEFGPEHNLRWTYYLAGFRYGSPAIGPTGTIYVPDNSSIPGGFTALRAGVSLAHTPWPKFRCNARNTGNAQDATP